MRRCNSSDSASSGSARSRAALKRGATRVFLSIAAAACLPLSAATVAIPTPAGEPAYKQPQLAVGGNTVALAWGSGNRVLFATSTDGGATFGAPVVVAESGVISLGMHRGPRVVIAKDSIIVSAIYGEKGRGADGDLLAFRSTDGGRTWSKAIRVNDRAAAAREGLHAMSADGDFVYAVWLDDRDGGKALYGAASTDGGVTWSANQKLYVSPDGHICECCHPSVVVRNGGHEIYAMFRNWLAGSRDMYLAKSTDGGRTFHAQKLGEGTWPLNACPMDGGGLVVDAKGPLTAWRRGGSLFVARPGERETELGAGKNVALAGGRTTAWSTPEGLMLKHGTAAPKLVDPAGQFPAGSGNILAWESNGTLKVARF